MKDLRGLAEDGFVALIAGQAVVERSVHWSQAAKALAESHPDIPAQGRGFDVRELLRSSAGMLTLEMNPSA